MKRQSKPPAKAVKPAKAAVKSKSVGDVALGVNIDSVVALAEIAREYDLAELSFSTGGSTLSLKRGAGVPSPAPVALPVAAPATLGASKDSASPTDSSQNGHNVVVSSPFVGTFYRSPSPEAGPFVDVGQRVKKGQVLCIVEAMKLMNEIEAETDGLVVACLAENSQTVEYGQVLFKLSPA